MRQAIETRFLLRRMMWWGVVFGLTLFMFNGQNLTANAATYTAISTDKTLADGDYISGTINGCTITIPTGATVTVTGQITVSGTVNMVGGGRLVRSSSFTNASMIKVSSGAVLNIGTASGASGITIDGNGIKVSADGGGICSEGGTVNLYNEAEVTNHYILKNDPFGGGIYIHSGTLNMFEGASVTNNTADVINSIKSYGGGGVAIWESAVFNMSGGTISGNKATSVAGGTGGGGVYTRGTFKLSGGRISENTSGRNGGAVHMDGGTNTTVSPVMTMTGGLITGNSSVWGGGIEIMSKSGLTITGGKINSNTCTLGGGGIELDVAGYSGYLKVGESAQVTGNSKLGNQDNVFVDRTIEVVGDFTGSIGITHETSTVNVVNGVFGTNTGSYNGMENFFCDGKGLVGVLSGTTVKWKSSSASLTSVALSTNTPFKGKTITTTLTTSSGSGEATYQWYRNTGNSNSGGALIVGATESSYTPSTADVGGYLYVVANGTGGSTGKVVSTATAAVQWPSVATPSFGVTAGTYISTKNVTITCSTDGAVIYYTTDGSTPTSGNTKYTGTITVASSQTIKAIAIKDEYYKDSEVASATYSFRSITTSPYTGMYDSKAHEAVAVTGIVAGDTVTYSNNNIDFSDTCPKYTDANSYEVYVKVENLSQGTWISNKLTAQILRADGSIMITGEPSKTYDGNAVSDPAVIKNGLGMVTFTYYKDNAGSIGEQLAGAPSTVGTYWVKAVMAQDTNYKTAEATKKFSITEEIASAYTITVQTEGSGTASANVASAISGSAITLSSVPAGGYRLKEWQVVSGGIIITGNTFVMPEDNVIVKAVFEVIPVETYPVTVNYGLGSGSGSGSYAVGATVNISADTPVNGKQFKGWSVVSGGVTLSSSTSAFATFTMPGNAVEIEAAYEDIAPNSYTITIQSEGNGNASSNVAAAVSGTAITLSAIPANGYRFKEWQVISGGSIIIDNSFIMPENNVTIKVVFEVIPIIIPPIDVPPVIIPTDNSSQASPMTREEKITVDVKSGDLDTAAAVITLQKNTETDGKITASVTFEEDKAKETIDNLGQAGKNVARIVIPDDKKEISELKIEIPTVSLNLMTANGINLEIDTDNGKIYVPNETLQETKNESEEELYFRLVPIKDETEKSQVIERAKQEAVVKIMHDAVFSIVGTPVTIETNLPKKEAEIILPLNNAELPVEAEAREEFLSKLAVYIEHSDGEKELVKGEIVDYSKGVLGIRFTVTKFSSFSIIKSDSFVSKSSECDIISVKAPSGVIRKDKELTASVENKINKLKLDLTASNNSVWKLYSNDTYTKEISGNIINLSIGKNIAYIKVTAEDGVTEKIYKLTITRKEKEDDSSLADNSSKTDTKIIHLPKADKNQEEKALSKSGTKATDTKKIDTKVEGVGKAPKTGGNSFALFYACLAGLAGTGLLILRRTKKAN